MKEWQPIHVRCRVHIRGDEDDLDAYTIVPPAEAEPRSGKISSESPLGRALLGRRMGERVVINAPGRSYTVTITAIEEPS